MTCTGLLRLLGLLIHISFSLCEMRKTIKVEKLPFPSASGHAANFSLDVGDQKEVTLCMKFRTFAYNEGYGLPFNIFRECPEGEVCADNFSWMILVGWKTGLEDVGKQALSCHTNFEQDNLTWYESTLQRPGKPQWHQVLFDGIELYEWQSACYSWSVTKKKEVLFINGKSIFGYNWSKEFKRGWSVYPLRLILMNNWRGEATDVNIYDSFFDKEEMVSWTTSCGIPTKGSLLSWEPEVYNLTNNKEMETVISEVASDELCPDQNDDIKILEIFDNGVGKSPIQSEHSCERLNGQLTLAPTSEKEAFDILKISNEYTRKKNLTYNTHFPLWFGGRADVEGTEFVETDDGYNLYPKGGKWVVKDPKTNEVLGTYFPAVADWDTYSKPTEMCISCGHNSRTRIISSIEKIYPPYKPCPKADTDCVNFMYCIAHKCKRTDFNIGFMCTFKEKLRLKLKGLCQDTKVDTDYLLLGYEVLGTERYSRRMYGGSTGWLLAFDQDLDSWQLRHEYYPHLTLTMEDKDQLPVGLHSWVAANNSCALGQTSRWDCLQIR